MCARTSASSEDTFPPMSSGSFHQLDQPPCSLIPQYCREPHARADQKRRTFRPFHSAGYSRSMYNGSLVVIHSTSVISRTSYSAGSLPLPLSNPNSPAMVFIASITN